jgi:MraZ protein
MQLFLSNSTNRIDRKGRVSVPSQFRAVLSAQNSPGQVVLFPSRDVKALEGCSLAWIETLSESVDDPDIDPEEREAIELLVFARLQVIQIDPDGRIVVPEEMISYAGFDEQVVYVGRRHTFQMWDPAELKAREGGVRERAPQMSLSTLVSRAASRNRARGTA